MEDYRAASCQKVNLLKSAIRFSPKIKPQLKMGMKEVLGIVKQYSTWQYLGVPVIAWRLRRAECDVVEQGIRDRLEGWQSRSLFMVRRVFLVRSVLSSVPVYLMTNTYLSKSSLIQIKQRF